ncbi:hypothetical protein GMMP15_50027 [Candidatus Magnetomoraceae bacterium gMMP-15]
MKRFIVLLFAVFFTCGIFWTVPADSMAITVDFDNNLPNAFAPSDNIPISNQFAAPEDGGVIFSLSNGNSPYLAEVGSPTTSFARDNILLGDTPVSDPDQGIIQYFLTPYNAHGSMNNDYLTIKYTVPVAVAKFDIIDIDDGEHLIIKAYNTDDEEIDEWTEDNKNIGDGIATNCSFERSSVDIQKITIRNTTSGTGGDFGFDNFYSSTEPIAAKFQAEPTSGIVPLTVNFKDETVGSNILTREWDFGDGSISTDQDVSHTYNNSGRYTVILTVTTTDGDTFQEEYEIYVAAKDAELLYVANKNDNSVSVIDTSPSNSDKISMAVIELPKVNQIVASPEGIAVNPDGTRVYVANSGNDTVSVIETATNTLFGEPISVGDQPHDIVAGPDGKRVYVTNLGNSTVSIINVENDANTLFTTVEMGSGIGLSGIVVDNKGYVYITDKNNDTVRIIEPTSDPLNPLQLSETEINILGEEPVAIAIDSTWTYLYTANKESDNVSKIDIISMDVVFTSSYLNEPVGIAVKPDGSHIYVVNQADGTLTEIDTKENQRTDTDKIGNLPVDAAVNNAGTYVYITNSDDNNISVFDIENNEVAAELAINVGNNPQGLVLVKQAGTSGGSGGGGGGCFISSFNVESNSPVSIFALVFLFAVLMSILTVLFVKIKQNI